GFLRRAQERAAVPEDGRRVALVQDLERPLVAVLGDRDEAFVRTTGEPPVGGPVPPGPDVNRPRCGDLCGEHRHVVRSCASLRPAGYRVTVNVIRRVLPSVEALAPARTSITYEPGRRDVSLPLRSVTRNRPAAVGVRVVV